MRYEHDIFISYAHVDNLLVPGEQEGWITRFHQHLEIRLWKRFGRTASVRIWRDPSVRGNQVFDQTIQEAIEKSALFLALVSTGYLSSDYCLRESTCFYRKALREPRGLKVGDASRIFTVLLNNIPFDKLPKEFEGTRGYAFHDAERGDESGEPVDFAGEVFRRQVRTLVDDIYPTLTQLRGLAEGATPLRPPTEEKPFSIFIADVADTLRKTRQRLVNELKEQNGMDVLEDVPPPYELCEHEKRLNQEIERADLCVHLIDGVSGREIEGSSITYQQRHAEAVLARERPQLVWVPTQLDVEGIEDEAQRKLLEKLENGARGSAPYDFVRESPAAIVREVLQKVAHLKTRTPSPAGAPRAALLETHLKDQLHAIELSRFLIEHGIQPYINPDQDDPSSNMKLFEERLKQVQILIVFFGQVAAEWVRERLGAALQIAIGHNTPLETCGIYVAPPRKSSQDLTIQQRLFPVHLMDNADSFRPETLEPLLHAGMKFGHA
jgi:hypothetical protein